MKNLNWFSTVKHVDFEGKKIEENSFLMIPTENGPNLYLVSIIIITDTTNFLIVAKKLTEIDLDQHYNSFEIYNFSFQWRLLDNDILSGCTITHYVRVASGIYYVVTNWF